MAATSHKGLGHRAGIGRKSSLPLQTFLPHGQPRLSSWQSFYFTGGVLPAHEVLIKDNYVFKLNLLKICSNRRKVTKLIVKKQKQKRKEKQKPRKFR